MAIDGVRKMSDVEDIPEGLFNYSGGGKDRLLNDNTILTQKEYGRRHRIMSELRPRPKDLLCEICHKRMIQHLSNIDHQYRCGKEFINEWQFLCNKCHTNHDMVLRLKQMEQQLANTCVSCQHIHTEVCPLCDCSLKA
jgi:hypothetical protein